MSDREKAIEVCEATHHEWKEEYYGYKCENCQTFIPYGCEPWAPDDDWLESIWYEPVFYQSRVAEQRDGAVLAQHSSGSSICPSCGHMDGYHPEWCTADDEPLS